MFGASFDAVLFLQQTAAVALTALAVRWMDDVVDGVPERPAPDPDLEGPGTVSRADMGGGAADPVVGRAVYSLVALALACALEGERAVTLFLCSYAVGMVGDGSSRLPLGLSPRLESAAALGLAAWVGGWTLAAAAFGTVLAIQVADDLHDDAEDAKTGAVNLARRFGTVEAACSGLVALLTACWIDATLVIQAFVAVAAAQAVAVRLASRWEGPRERLAFAASPEGTG